MYKAILLHIQQAWFVKIVQNIIIVEWLSKYLKKYFVTLQIIFESLKTYLFDRLT